jgi:hypothetical protein
MVDLSKMSDVGAEHLYTVDCDRCVSGANSRTDVKGGSLRVSQITSSEASSSGSGSGSEETMLGFEVANFTWQRYCVTER